MSLSRIATIVICVVVCFHWTVPTQAEVDIKVEYNRDVRPILSDHCFACHGPDANNRKGDLRLDLSDAAVAAQAIVPNKPGESHVIQRIESIDPETVMPPPHANKNLTDRQKDILRAWVAQGAVYQKHWSYEAPNKVGVPGDQNPIDFIIQKRLEQVGLRSAPEADRRTLIRRLSLDLVGLPPNPDEVEAFEKDGATHAYEVLVDRLLASPHYGERMAISWLDAVRFADTIGYHSDNPRNIWPYRDYVIRSFNSNKPFDRFTIEQLAGDLLPDADQETRVGSAFNRLLLTTEEGGAQAKDYESRMLADRVRAVGTVWLGQTTGCSQCHDHKFDPFTMRDFYSLGAFFADIQEGIIGAREPGMLVAKPEEHQRLAELEAAVSKAKQAVDAVVPQLDAAQRQWEADVQAYDFMLAELKPDSKSTDAEKAKANSIVAILKLENRNDQQKNELRDYFRSRICKLFVTERESLAKAEKERNELQQSLPKCLVSQSTPNKRVVRIQPRGNWLDESGEVVRPALPQYLVPTAPGQESRELNRLDLAKWLVERSNPLTARTTVNRLWKQYFGIGLSKTLDDLGAQGEPPANQELLDWLAVELIDSGWDIKHMVRMIVTSKAYRQSSIPTHEQLAADPYNRLIARQSSFRLDAELVRDVAMSVSGLLNSSIGGPSAKPYQPEGYWDNLNFPPRQYASDKDANQYRRGLYTWWQRSFLHPSMVAFDAPTREECCAERGRSNIPQQALVLLNDPTYVEASRALAERVLRECKDSSEARIHWAYRRTLQRSPRLEEVSAIQSLLNQQMQVYRADPALAEQLATVGNNRPADDIDRTELAAWIHVARVLLNLHETITRS